MKKQTLLTILLAAFGAANAATSMPNSELIGVASFNDQNSAKDVCLANNIVDERCESGNHKAVITVSKYNLKGTFGGLMGSSPRRLWPSRRAWASV